MLENLSLTEPKFESIDQLSSESLEPQNDTTFNYMYGQYVKILTETGLYNRLIQIFIIFKATCVLWFMGRGIYLYCKTKNLCRPKEIIVFTLAMCCGVCILVYEVLIGFVITLYMLTLVSSVCATIVWLDLLEKNIKS